MHGGAGDDAILGAEAPITASTFNYSLIGTQVGGLVRSDYSHPFNPGNVLGYSPTLTYQAQYDPNNPMVRIFVGGQNWLMNFESGEGQTESFWTGGTPYITDGNDHMFGDLGNDWLVGGTGRDTMWGGWGNDYMQADDNLNTDAPEANASWEDMAFGGAGRDVLIANTGGDRLIDWAGEFNSYLVPFNPFGMATVSRTNQPQLPEYLYMLSRSEGADQTLAAQHAPSFAGRNGEPFGELGLVRQEDAAWGDQRGGPRDPQAGNHHAQRDVHWTSGSLFLDDAPPWLTPTSPLSIASAPVDPTISAPALVNKANHKNVALKLGGPKGSVAVYTISDGTRSVTGAAAMGDNESLSVMVDLSGLSDGTLTATATFTDILGNVADPVNTSIQKVATPPSAPGFNLPAYVGRANRNAVPLSISGAPGTSVAYSVTDGTSTLNGTGTIGSAGTMTAILDLTAFADGTLTATASLTDFAGNSSSAGTARAVKDTVGPSGTFKINGGTTVVNGMDATRDRFISLDLSFTDTGASGLNLLEISTDNGVTWTPAEAYISSEAAALPDADGVQTVSVRVTDAAGNSVVVSKQVRLDRSGPAITETGLTNGAVYDLGQLIKITFGASDVDGVKSMAATLDTKAIVSGTTINTESLGAGSHTLVITATDLVGNTSTLTITFVLRVTTAGLTSAVNDGVSRGQIDYSLSVQLNNNLGAAQSAINRGDKAGAKSQLQSFISKVQSNAGSKKIDAGYAAQLIGWANDLISRL
jgi:hypothetical protein